VTRCRSCAAVAGRWGEHGDRVVRAGECPHRRPVVELEDGPELDLILAGVTARVDGGQPGDAADYHASGLGVQGTAGILRRRSGWSGRARCAESSRAIGWVRYEAAVIMRCAADVTNDRPGHGQDLMIKIFQAACCLASSPGRSTSLPLMKVAPARTRATRCGALTRPSGVGLIR
jgi:hypothetical protein